MDFQRTDLEEDGFKGFINISYLKENGCGDIPKKKGVYVVVRESSNDVCFIEESIGGRYKGRNPTVSISELEANWVDGAYVTYIGRTGKTLRSRINLCIEFGKGEEVRHWGGRYIWQLKDSDELLIAWKPLDDEEPEDVKISLIDEFIKQYGKLLFARLKKR